MYLCCVVQVCAMNVILVLCIIISLPFVQLHRAVSISMILCDISMILCDISMILCDISMILCDISMILCDISMLCCPGVRNERHPGVMRHHQLAVCAAVQSCVYIYDIMWYIYAVLSRYVQWTSSCVMCHHQLAVCTAAQSRVYIYHIMWCIYVVVSRCVQWTSSWCYASSSACRLCSCTEPCLYLWYYVIYLCCVVQVCAMNVILVLCVIISLPFVQLHRAMSVFCLLVTSIVILLKMIYHLDLVPNTILQTNCSVSPLHFICFMYQPVITTRGNFAKFTTLVQFGTKMNWVDSEVIGTSSVKVIARQNVLFQQRQRPINSLPLKNI